MRFFVLIVLADFPSLQKYINAFLNTNGGIIYFGVEDDGTIAGVPLNRAGRDDLRLRIDSVVSSANLPFQLARARSVTMPPRLPPAS